MKRMYETPEAALMRIASGDIVRTSGAEETGTETEADTGRNNGEWDVVGEG